MSLSLAVSALSFTASACLYASASNLRSQARLIDSSKASNAANIAKVLMHNHLMNLDEQVKTLNQLAHSHSSNHTADQSINQSNSQYMTQSISQSINQSSKSLHKVHEHPTRVYAEFIGRARCDKPLLAPMSGLACVAYEYTVERVNQSISQSIKLEPTLPMIMNQPTNQPISTAVAVPVVTANTTSEVVAHYQSINQSKSHHYHQPISANQNDQSIDQSCDHLQIDDGSGVPIILANDQIPDTAFITSVDTMIPPPPIDQSINQLVNQSISLNSFRFPIYPSETNHVIGYRLIERIIPLNAILTAIGIASVSQSTDQPSESKITISLDNSVQSNDSTSQSQSQPIGQSASQAINQSINHPTDQSIKHPEICLTLSPPPPSDLRAFVVSIIDVHSLAQARMYEADQLMNASMVSSLVGAASLGWWWINRR